MGIRAFFLNYVESIINEIQHKKKQERQKAFFDAATYDQQLVRIDDTAAIANNRIDKKFISIGDNTWIKGELLTFKHGGEIAIGTYSFVGEHSKIWSSAKVQIGNNVLISHNVNILDTSGHPLNSGERHLDFKHIRYIGLQDTVNIDRDEIIIGNDVWIGFNATILKGVTIGNGAIIGANTIITKDVPPFAVIVGNPPRITKYTS